jgi:hypothetical protein
MSHVKSAKSHCYRWKCGLCKDLRVYFEEGCVWYIPGPRCHYNHDKLLRMLFSVKFIPPLISRQTPNVTPWQLNCWESLYLEPHAFQFEIDSNEFSIKILHIGFEYVNIFQPLFLICAKQLANESRVSMGLWYNGNICVLLKYKYKHDQTAESTRGGWCVYKLNVTLVQKS